MIIKKESRRYGMPSEVIASDPATSMTRKGGAVRFLVGNFMIEISAEEIRRLILTLAEVK